jgi:hemerythrin superfamily protein
MSATPAMQPLKTDDLPAFRRYSMADTKLRIKKATALLREDHRKVKKLFSQYEKLEDGEERKGELFQTIQKELTIHAQIEEELFYPALEKIDDEETREFVLEAHEEHKVVKTFLSELSQMTPEDEGFDAKMKVMMESVKHHADEEEENLFPCFDEDLPKEERDRIAEQLRSRKEELTAGEEEEGETSA